MKYLIANTLTILWLVFGSNLMAGPATATKAERAVFDYFGDRDPIVLRLWPEGSVRNRSRNGKAEVAELTNKLRYTNTESPSLLICPPRAVIQEMAGELGTGEFRFSTVLFSCRGCSKLKKGKRGSSMPGTNPLT